VNVISWVVDDWRLKLLAFGLAVLMLGAVAFSQNPPTTRTLQVPLQYTQVGENQNLVILNPPSTVSITFSGLADVIGAATPNNFSATVDATHATAGPAVKLNVTVVSTIKVDIQNPAPIVVHIDNLIAVELPIQVVAHGAPGWSVTKTSTTPPTVHFTGPQSWEVHPTATVVIGTPIAATNPAFLNQPVQLTNSNGALSLIPCTTWPCATVDVAAVDVTITAQTGTTSTTVALVAATPSQLPPPSYEITGVTISPATVVITGDPTALAKIQRIVLPALDLSGATSTVQIQVNIPYPDGVTPLNGAATASVTYKIQRNPLVSPSP
jgi:YbbR domain-containing protein